LKNPHNFPARKFAVKAQRKDEAVFAHYRSGPYFGDDIGVSDSCNCSYNHSYLGLSYANDAGRDGQTVLTGSFTFTVKEIEVFEITD
jgi:hypothetical protein